jgi:MFS family permease
MLSEKPHSLIIFTLFVIALLNEISYQMVIPMMNHVVNFTLPLANAALLNLMYGAGIAAFTTAVIVGSPLVGFLSDKFGRKPVLSGCILLMLFSAGLFLLALYLKSITYFLMARFLSGLSGASTAIVQAAIADRTSHRTRNIHFSTVGLALTVGLIVGPLLGGYFIKGENIHFSQLSMPFLMTGALSLLSLFLFLLTFEEQKHSEKDYDHMRLHKPARNMLRFFCIFFLLEFSWSLYYLILPTFLGSHFSYDSQKVSVFLSTTGVSMCFGLMSYRLFSQWFNNVFLIRATFALFILSIFLVMMFKNILLTWMTILPISFSVAISYVALMGLLSENAAHERQGVVMGTTLTLMALAWTITGFSAKLLYGVHAAAPFVIAILGLVVGIVFTSTIKKAMSVSLLQRERPPRSGG